MFEGLKKTFSVPEFSRQSFKVWVSPIVAQCDLGVTSRDPSAQTSETRSLNLKHILQAGCKRLQADQHDFKNQS